MGLLSGVLAVKHLARSSWLLTDGGDEADKARDHQIACCFKLCLWLHTSVYVLKYGLSNVASVLGDAGEVPRWKWASRRQAE